MSTGMPELGSKISLISKADIRYEGRLFTVDPQECTIALASVRSFGTEDRETQYPVAPQNQVYDYILFRGSDIKDIRVVNNVSTLPNDPAIMQLSVPPSLGQQSYQPQGFSHPVLGPMGPQMGQYNNPYGGLGAMGGLPSGLAPGIGINRDLRNLSKQQSSELLSNVLSGPIPQPDIPHSADQGIKGADDASVLELISGGSRSTTPVSLLSRKSPTVDQSVQAGTGTGSGSGSGKDDKKTVQRPIQPPAPAHAQRKDTRTDNHHDQRQHQHRGQHHPQQQQRPPQQNHQNHHQNQQMQNHSQQHNQHNQQHNQHNQQHNQQQQQANRGGWINRGNMRQRGRGRGGPQGMFRPPQGTQNTGAAGKPKSTLKFDNDYDFEQANTEFEELRSQLAKVKIAEEPKPVATEVNGESEKKDDSGNETGAGDTEHEEDQEVYYDKAKSFFDNISCEAVERSKGRSQRTDWRTERKLNSETFGVSSTRRGGYRGRGGYYNRGMYRGSYRGQYRGQPQRNPRQNQQQHNMQQQQQQQHNMQPHQQQQGHMHPHQQQQQQPSQQPQQPPVVAAAAGK